MKKRISLSIALAAGLILSAIACGAGDEGKHAVESSGFTDVVMGDTAYWGCGKNDDANSHFTATNAQGRRVSGVVCCNMVGCGKACTVRF